MTLEQTPEAALASVSSLEFKLPKWPRMVLIKLACKEHNRRQREKAARLDDLFAEVAYLNPHSSEVQLARISVNYLRGRCEQQQPQVANWRGQPAYFEAYARAKARILNEIAQNYAWLAAECGRQNVY